MLHSPSDLLQRVEALFAGVSRPDETLLVIGEGPDAHELRNDLKGLDRGSLDPRTITRWFRVGLVHYLSAEGLNYLFPALVSTACTEPSGEALASLLYLLAEGNGEQFAAFSPEQFAAIDAVLEYATSQRRDDLVPYGAIGDLEAASLRWKSAT